MKRHKQPVRVYERTGNDGLISFYHHVTIHGQRTRERLDTLGRHKRNSRSYLLARKEAEKAATVRSADIFRGEFGMVENRGAVSFMRLVEDHCHGKARSEWRVQIARRFWGSALLSQVTEKRVDAFKRQLMEDYSSKTAFEVFTITCKAVLRNAFEEGWIRTDPSRRVQNPPNVADNKPELLTQAEVLSILDWTPKARSKRCNTQTMSVIHRASCFMLHTGLLLAEIRELTFNDIAEGYIEIIRCKNRGKSHARSFCLSLSEEALSYAGQGERTDRVFPIEGDSAFFRKGLQFIADDVGIKKTVLIRSLRTTLLTQMALNGAGAHAIQSVAGHSRITMSQEYVRRADQLQLQSLSNVYQR